MLCPKCKMGQMSCPYCGESISDETINLAIEALNDYRKWFDEGKEALAGNFKGEPEKIKLIDAALKELGA